MSFCLTISPDEGSEIPAKSFNNVVLPAPFLPVKPMRSPWVMIKLTLFIRSKPPKLTFILFAEIIDIFSMPPKIMIKKVSSNDGMIIKRRKGKAMDAFEDD